MNLKLFSFSIKNAFRRKSILVIALIGTGLGTALMATLMSLSYGMDEELNRTMNLVASDITVNASDSAGMTSFLGGGTPLPSDYYERIVRIENVKAAEPLINSTIPNEVLDENISMSPVGAFFTGVDLELNKLNGGSTTKIIEGRSIRDSYEIIMGSQAGGRPGQESLGLEIGDTIEIPLMTQFEIDQSEVSTDESLQNYDPYSQQVDMESPNLQPVEKQKELEKITFEIVGIFESGSGFDDGGFIASIDDLRELTGMSYDEVSSFTVTAIDTNSVEQVAEDIEKEFENDTIPVKTTLSKDILGELNETLDIFQTFILVISLVSAVAGGMSIFIIMLMSVIERLQEFGIFKATGWSNFNIVVSVIIESITVALLGSLLGLSIGFVVGTVINNQLGTDVAIFDQNLIAVIIGFGVVMGVLGGVLPALKAARVSPIETLHSL